MSWFTVDRRSIFIWFRSLQCYDMRFPEVAVLLRKMGANILTYPSAFAYTTGLAHWETLLRSRAIENQCYVIAAAQIGWHNKKRRSYGHAMVIQLNYNEYMPLICLPLSIIDSRSVGQNRRGSSRGSRPRCNGRRHWSGPSGQRSSEYALFRASSRWHLLTGSVVRRSRQAARGSRNVWLWWSCRATRVRFPGHTPFVCLHQYSVCRSGPWVQHILRCLLHAVQFTPFPISHFADVLVATKRSVAKLSDLTPEESVDFFQAVMRVQKSLGKCHNATAMTVTVQDGADAGQTVKHVHCHIMPRKKGDFEDNDMIYTELNKHDAPDNRTDRRPLQEMVDEAQWYRDTGF